MRSFMGRTKENEKKLLVSLVSVFARYSVSAPEVVWLVILL